jgi:hypothetical protein
VTGSLGALLVSPFNVKWRFSALAGSVEGSKFCLFSVVLPARCVSSFSPKVHYRGHAFCFLPLAAILEFYKASLNKYKKIEMSPCILPDQDRMKLEIHSKRNYRKYLNMETKSTC